MLTTDKRTKRVERLSDPFLGYEALANDPEVEVVYVGAIHPAHLEICRLMFNAGKHILCEKVVF